MRSNPGPPLTRAGAGPAQDQGVPRWCGAPRGHRLGDMTTTPPEAPSGPSAGTPDDDGPRVTRDEMRDLGRLRRSATDRKVAGVAGGLARHLDVDPLILRVAFVVLVLLRRRRPHPVRRLLAARAGRGDRRGGRHPRRPQPHPGAAGRRRDRGVRPDRRLVGRLLVPVAARDRRAGGAVLRHPQGPADPRAPGPTAAGPARHSRSGPPGRPTVHPAAGAVERADLPGLHRLRRLAVPRAGPAYGPPSRRRPARGPATRAAAARSCSGSRSR